MRKLVLLVLLVLSALAPVRSVEAASVNGAEFRSVTVRTDGATGFWCDGTTQAAFGTQGYLSASALGFTGRSSITVSCVSNKDAAIYNNTVNTVPTWHLFNGDRIQINAPSGWLIYGKRYSGDIIDVAPY